MLPGMAPHGSPAAAVLASGVFIGFAAELDGSEYSDIQYGGAASFATFGVYSSLIYSGSPGGYGAGNWGSGPLDPALYELVVTMTGAPTSGPAAGTYSLAADRVWTVSRAVAGVTLCTLTVKIQLASAPGVILSEADVIIRARTINNDPPEDEGGGGDGPGGGGGDILN